MKTILSWPLLQNSSIRISSLTDGLSTFTACTMVDIALVSNGIEYDLYKIKASDLLKLYDLLLNLIEQKADQISFLACLNIKRQGHNFLLTLNSDHTVFDHMLDLNTLISWSRQLELLRIVMDENLLEKQEKKQGCC